MDQTQTETETKPAAPPYTGEMAIMGREGDTKIIWSKTTPVEVDVAKMAFDKLKKDGYSAYSVSDNGDKKGDPVKDFDPNMERLVMVPPMQAG